MTIQKLKTTLEGNGYRVEEDGDNLFVRDRMNKIIIVWGIHGKIEEIVKNCQELKLID